MKIPILSSKSVLYSIREEKIMSTKERIVVKEVLVVLSLMAFLVFCSFLVSHRLTDILYFGAIMVYMLYYILGRRA